MRIDIRGSIISDLVGSMCDMSVIDRLVDEVMDMN